jgi:hypothetical protein
LDTGRVRGDLALRILTAATAATGAAVLGVASAAAGAPPHQLYGKGIRIEYTVETVHAGNRGPHTVFSDIRRTVYVSSTGRLFERTFWSTRGGTRTGEHSPNTSRNGAGEARGMSFNGNALVANIAYASGAGQMTVTFDPSFSSCNGRVMFGKSGGQTMSRRGPDGQMHRILSIGASNFSCSVVSGNPF